MKKASFAHYLQQIKNSRPINIERFLTLAESYSLSHEQLAEIFSWKKINAKQYAVTIVKQSLFEQLCARFPVLSITNRKQASAAGDSHAKRVSGSMLTVLAYQHSFPQLLVFARDSSYQTPYPLHKHLLVIENMENFLAVLDQAEYPGQWLDGEWPCDIVYAQGNAIGNRLHQQFFSQYDKIRCLLDIDLGGFEIFKNINTLAPKNSCSYVLSDYYLQKYIQYGNPLTQQQRQELSRRSYPKALEKVINTVLKYNQFAEQEILLCS